ncbi:MAG TPA: ATPase domain-containing protein [Thermoanaerobaculia bacterium]|nr:ATPase domain-containing protein [Thermoanaerobaculia bacterium]
MSESQPRHPEAAAPAGGRPAEKPREPELAPTGVEGLDEILGGGLTAGRLYLLEGYPGSGKTTIALQFLLEGLQRGERVLYVTLSETGEELRAAAESHGWSLEGITLRELIPSEESLQPEAQYTVFHPSEVELADTTRTILADAEAVAPRRVVFDSLSEMRLLASSALRYRRQVLALKQFFTRRGCTALMIDDRSGGDDDRQLRSIANGIILLEQLHPEYGAERRRVSIVKHRASRYRGGYHDFVIRPGGVRIFPRLVAAEERHQSSREQLSSGLSKLDTLLGGGVERGTSTLIAGAAGTGKSTISLQFASAAAARGERACLFLFDESPTTLLMRARGLNIPAEEPIRDGRILVRQVDPAELSPGEFASAVLAEARQPGTSIVVIDSLNGYLNAMPEERFLVTQLHELLTSLGQLGIATLLVGVQHGLIGGALDSPVDASYLADSIVQLRYFEIAGEVRQAISVIKKRAGPHERTIRELRMDGGLQLGEPLREYQGVLTGVPTKVFVDPGGRG